MAAQEGIAKKKIGNVGMLDLRSATEESVAGIAAVGNVGVVLYAPETAALLTRLNMGNMGTSVEAPVDARLLSGQTVCNHAYFADQPEPLYLVVGGQLIIEKEVTVEDLEKGLEAIAGGGQIFCPEHLMGALQARLKSFGGQILDYRAEMKMAMGSITLDADYLEDLEEGVELMVMGKVAVPQILDDELLKRKIVRLRVMGKIHCREENVKGLRAILDDRMGTAKIEAIPAGFEPVDGQLVLDELTLGALPGRKIYCPRVQVAEDVEAEALEGALDRLDVAGGLLICPARLKGVVAGKCDLLKARAIFYEGALWLVEEEQELLASRFDYLEGKATLVVCDLLTISPEIEPKMLAERLDKVHNLEAIRCTPEQMGAIQARLGIDRGELIDSTREQEEEEEEGEGGIGNVGYLRL